MPQSSHIKKLKNSTNKLLSYATQYFGKTETKQTQIQQTITKLFIFLLMKEPKLMKQKQNNIKNQEI